MERITPGEVDRLLRQHLRRRSDMGLWNALTAMIFEPHSTEPRRKPHRWFVLFVLSLVAAVAAFGYFNFLN